LTIIICKDLLLINLISISESISSLGNWVKTSNANIWRYKNDAKRTKQNILLKFRVLHSLSNFAFLFLCYKRRRSYVY